MLITRCILGGIDGLFPGYQSKMSRMMKRPSAGGFASIWYAISAFFSVGFFSMLRGMLSKNACKTCALGMGGQKGGMKNEQGRFPEVCKKSLQAMKSDMQGAIPERVFTNMSMEELGRMGPRKLDKLGRIPFPLYASSSDTHLKKISWEAAFDKIVEKMKATDPLRSFFYFSGRSSNEAGFLLQIMARVYGTNHVNNCSYYCHQASGVGLGKSLGSGTATLNLEDIENSDLFILIGANPTSNHPRLLTTLMHLKRRGGKVIVINPVEEPGLQKFRIPSSVRSLLFGTKIADLYVQPHIGGDQALTCGIGKYLIEKNAIDEDFIFKATENYLDYKKLVEALSWQEIVEQSGVDKNTIAKIGDMYIASNATVFSWAMGITHHKNGVANVQNIVNLSLLRGMIGRRDAGLLPLRGHSNVQGMGTVGVTPALKQQVFNNLTKLGFKLPTHEGNDTMACMEAATRGEVDFAWYLGGNLYASNPDLAYASRSMNKVGFALYMNTTLNEGHFYGRGRETIILPVLARDEESESTTQESMFNFVRLSDGGPSRIPGLKSETHIVSEIASRLFGNTPINWAEMKKHKNIRELIAKTIPGLEEIESIGESKKEFIIPGRIFHTPSFPTESGKAKFAATPLPHLMRNGQLTLMTIRSEGQFNTVVFEEEDAWRKIERRDVILLHPDDMNKFNLTENQKVTIKSETGRMDNILVRSYNIRPGNALMYYPEANILVSRDLDPESKTPAYKNTQIQIQ